MLGVLGVKCLGPRLRGDERLRFSRSEARQNGPVGVQVGHIAAQLLRLRGCPERLQRLLVAEIVEGWTGIPAGRMRSDEIRTVLGLREAMQRLSLRPLRLICIPIRIDLMAYPIQRPCARASWTTRTRRAMGRSAWRLPSAGS